MRHITDENMYCTSLPPETVAATKVQTVCGIWTDRSEAVSFVAWADDSIEEVTCQPCLFGNAIRRELGSLGRSIESLTEEIRRERRVTSPSEMVVPNRSWWR